MNFFIVGVPLSCSRGRSERNVFVTIAAVYINNVRELLAAGECSAKVEKSISAVVLSHPPLVLQESRKDARPRVFGRRENTLASDLG
jgi:hypothetical protein